MEKLVNCNIHIEIDVIDKISGGNQFYEVFFTSKKKEKYKLIFDFVWDIRCSIECACIDRSSKFHHAEKERSSILLIENSDYVQYFEQQASGTRQTSELKDFILFDSVDTVIELLTLSEPVLVRI